MYSAFVSKLFLKFLMMKNQLKKSVSIGKLLLDIELELQLLDYFTDITDYRV